MIHIDTCKLMEYNPVNYKENFYIPMRMMSGGSIIIPIIFIIIIILVSIALIFCLKKSENKIIIPENDFLI